MNRKHIIQIAFALLILIILVLILSKCSSSKTSPPQLSVIQLPDGSKFVVRGSSEMGLSALAGSGSGILEDQARLVQGEVLVISEQPAGSWFTILNPKGFIAHVTASSGAPGAIMLVNFDPATGKFTLDCILGICELGSDALHLTNVPAGQQGALDQSGIYHGPTSSSPNINLIYGTYIQAGGQVPTYTLITSLTSATTPTFTSTLDYAATATVVCRQFSSQFPGTPCPPFLSPPQAATATAVCQKFHAQFPSTPCP